jgi:alkylation response protein AidB-like acyl-CoA dehydrogenase
VFAGERDRREQEADGMDLTFSQEYQDFRAEVRDFIARNKDHAPRSRGGVEAPTPEMIDWQKRLIAHGYAARTVPKEYGGFGAAPDPLKTYIIGVEFTKAGAPLGLGSQGITLLVPTLLEHGTEEQKRRYIPDTITGVIPWCQGYSEPGAGSDLASLQTAGRVEGDEFVINGQKIWTSSAHFAEMMFCLVRTEPDRPKHHGISYILIPMDTPGIEVRPLATMTGRSEFNEVFFTDVRVPTSNIVGARGEGWAVANTTLKYERDALSDPDHAGSMLRNLIALMQNETADGRTLMDDPVFRDRLLKLQARVEAMRLNNLRLLTASMKKQGAGVPRLVSKLVGTHLMQDIAALGMDVLGELGVLYEQGDHLRSHGAWPFRYMFQLGMIIGGGTSHIQKNIIAERGLGMPREPKVAAA